jgi:DNA-binding transcriptional LysR family regulator
MYLNDHLEKLKYFYEIARLGSFKKAAESISITQPSLTKSIKILEDAVENPLFKRLPRGVALTQQGEILYKFCHELFASIANLEHKLAHPKNPMAGTLRVGTYDSIGIYFWPSFLKNFLPKYPLLNLEITTARSQHMQHKLEEGLIDFALIIEPKANAHIATEIIQKDTFKLYTTTHKKKTYKNLKEAPLILMESAIAGIQSLDDVLNSYGLGERQLYKTSSLESVKALTLSGLGIGLLPQMVAKDSLRKKLLIEQKLPHIPAKGIGEHNIGIAYQKGRKDSPLITTLTEHIKKLW